ncbi:MAG: ABC transporter substrate-binding protein [Deltaproteobacteria bacterium]|nr:ABC transporter substrate-binding protein [Deltaproteobacteria bacterium]
MNHDTMNTVRITVFALVALSTALCPFGCNRGPVGRAPVLVVGRARDAITLDPARATDVDSSDVIMQIYDTLVAYAPMTFKVIPSLAVSWSKSTDLRTWTFQIRKGVLFQDGTRLDADAVVYSFLRQSRGGVHQKDFVYWNSSFASIIKDVTKVSPYSVRFVLTRPFAPFLASLAMFPVSIVSPKSARSHHDDLSQHPVGTGPFQFVSWDKTSGVITLKAFPKYWGGKPGVKRIVFRQIRNSKHRLLALESGAAHIVRDLDPTTLQLIRLHPELRVMSTMGNTVSYVALNTSRPPFNNPYARWAVNRAIRKRILVKLIYQGLAEPATGPIPPVLSWAYAKNVTKYPYEPQRARRELAAAGYHDDPAHRPTLYVMDSPRPYLPKPLLAARMIASDLKRVGMPVRIVAQSFKQHKISMKRGEHDLALYGWVGDNGDPDNFLYVLLSPRSPLNMAFWQDASYARLVEAAREAKGTRQRASYYRKAQAIATRQAPWIPLAYTKVVVAVSSRVVGFKLSPSTILHLARVKIR